MFVYGVYRFEYFINVTLMRQLQTIFSVVTGDNPNN